MKNPPPDRPPVSIRLVDAEILIGLAGDALTRLNETFEDNPALSSEKRAEIATKFGQVAQAVINLTTATRATHRDWRESVDDWQLERSDRIHAAAGNVEYDENSIAAKHRDEAPYGPYGTTR
jgi:hypothetical protein